MENQIAIILVVAALISYFYWEKRKGISRSLNKDGKSLNEDGKRNYTFGGLKKALKGDGRYYLFPFVINNLERRERTRYSPEPLRIPECKVVKWDFKSDNYKNRRFVSQTQIDVSELIDLQATKHLSLDEQLDRDMAYCLAAVGSYPVLEPQAEGKVPPPDEPNLFEGDPIGILPADLLAKMSESDKDYVRGFVQNKNLEMEEEYQEADHRYQNALSATQKAFEIELTKWQTARRRWDETCAADLESLRAIREGISNDVEQFASLVLSYANLPEWIPDEFGVSYDTENKILIVEHRLPNLDEIEWYKVVFLKRSKLAKPLNKTERKKVFAEFYPLLTLSLATLLAKNFDSETVTLIAVNGWVEFRSKATGAQKRAFCSSLTAETAKLQEIDLEHADPLTAYKSLKGVTTPSLELAPVAPQMRLDMEDDRFVEARDVLQGLKNEENLAAMDWEDFEHLCRELFEKVFASEGATVSVTQASRDQGVDAIVLDPDPIRGGKIVIQAKRYVNTVDVSAVRDLWGVVSHEGAMKGLLVTTSQFGPDAYAFAQGKPLTLVNGSELLHLLEENGYSFRINLEEARRLQRESGIPPFAKRW